VVQRELLRAANSEKGGSLMDYIRGVTRNQVILFPEAVEDSG
jgi:hypothetical protein